MTLEERVEILEKNYNNLTQSLVDAQRSQRPVVDKADSASNKIPQVDANTIGVAENDSAICDVAELSDVNSTAIDDFAEMIDDLEQRVSALEEA